MTTGHKHRIRKVRSPRLMALLRKPLVMTTDLSRVDASPYPYGEIHYTGNSPLPSPDVYYLSALSLLHRWTGLTLVPPASAPTPPELTRRDERRVARAVARGARR